MSPPTVKQKLKILADNIASCKSCDISKLCEHKVTYRLYNPEPSRFIDILFVGEAPGDSEYIHKEPFIGPSGQVMQDIIDASVPVHLSYCITNSILCTPYTDEYRRKIRVPSLSEVKECSKHIAALINATKPKKMIAVGKIADKSLTRMKGIQKVQHVCILHPSVIMQSDKFNYEFDRAVLTIQEYLKQ